MFAARRELWTGQESTFSLQYGHGQACYSFNPNARVSGKQSPSNGKLLTSLGKLSSVYVLRQFWIKLKKHSTMHSNPELVCESLELFKISITGDYFRNTSQENACSKGFIKGKKKKMQAA